jgi:hypothetical protein
VWRARLGGAARAGLFAAAVVAATVVAAACSAPAPPPDLARAERFEAGGKDAEALDSFARAASSCDGRKGKELRDRWCAAALLGRASTLERLGRLPEAADAYEAVRLRVDGDPASRGLAEAARLRLALGEEERAYDLYWKVIAQHPDELAAEDALRRVVVDGRRRNARQLRDVLAELRTRLEGTEIADNLLYTEAILDRDDLADPAAALAALDAYVEQYPEGPLLDDALWEAAKLARAAGDGKGAVTRLRKLLATRDQAYVLGSYHSVHLDDAQLLAGQILRDDLGDARGAASAFAKIGEHYPDSTLRDDALWEEAATREALGETARACKLLARLGGKFPDSRWNLTEAPAAKTRLGCAIR